MASENIQLLDQKIKSAVNLIQQLRQENIILRKKLGEYESRIAELEEVLYSLKSNQKAIEDGLLQAIHELDKLDTEPSAASWESSPISEKTQDRGAAPSLIASEENQDSHSPPDSHKDPGLDIF